MKVVIVSDSHGNLGVLKRIVRKEEPFDLMFHLGDGIEEAIRLQKLIGFNLDGVEGNNDVKGVFTTSLTLRLGKKNCLFTHGHLCDVHRDLALLVAHAGVSAADLVFFGHTHHYYDGTQRRLRLMNPGSVCNYLTEEPTYIVLKMEGRELKIEKLYVPNENTC